MAKQSSRTTKTVLNFTTGIAGQLLITLLKFVTRTVFIQTLGASYLGINGLFTNILSMLSLTELGFDTAINFRMYKPLAERDEKRIRILLKFYKQVYRIIGIVILVIGLALIPALKYLINDYESLEALGINAALVFVLYLLQSVSSYLFFAYRSAIIKADQKTYITDIADMVVTVATNIFQICVLVFFHDFILYTATVIVFNIIKNGVNAIIAQKMYPTAFQKEKDHLSKDEVVSMVKDCGALFVYKVNNTVISSTDNLVISAFVGLTTVGLYSNYLLFQTTIKSFINKFYESCKASMGNLYATSNEEKSFFVFDVMNFISAILYGTAGVGIAVCANELVNVWIGKEYLIAQPFSILMGIEMFFTGNKLQFGQMRDVSGIFRKMWFRPVIGVIINLGVSIVLVQFIGIYGVIVGTITADILSNFMVDPRVIYKYAFKEYKPVSYYYKMNLSYLLVLVVMGAVDFLICGYVCVGHGWISAIVHILICAVSVPLVFLAIYWRTENCKYLRGKAVEMFRKATHRLAR